MIQLSAAGKRFGPKLLFEDLHWLITPKDRARLGRRERHRQIHAAEGSGRLESLDYGIDDRTKGHDAPAICRRTA